MPEEFEGIMAAIEFVKEDDDEREAGTYVTVRLDTNPRLGAGRVRLTYL